MRLLAFNRRHCASPFENGGCGGRNDPAEPPTSSSAAPAYPWSPAPEPSEERYRTREEVSGNHYSNAAFADAIDLWLDRQALLVVGLLVSRVTHTSVYT